MLVNADKLPLEGISRIEVTLNRNLYQYIDLDTLKKNNHNNHLRLRQVKTSDTYWYLAIQAQYINYLDVRVSIAEAVSELIYKKIINLPISISLDFIYFEMDWFVSEVREIDFYFDFTAKAITVAEKEKLIHHKGSLYSADWKENKNGFHRKSSVIIHDHKPHIPRTNQLSHNLMIKNNFSRRIELRLCRNNCSYLTLDNLTGSYPQVITRYTPFLGTFYHRHVGNDIVVDTPEHPYFADIYEQAKPSDGKRRKWALKKAKPYRLSKIECEFHKFVYLSKVFKPEYSQTHPLPKT